MTADEERVSRARRLREERPLDAAAARAAVAAVTLMNESFEAGPRATRRELADALGVSEGRVSQLLNGDGNVRVSTLARMLAASGSGLVMSHDERADVPVPRPRRSVRPRPATVYATGELVTVLERDDAGEGLRQHTDIHLTTRPPHSEVVGRTLQWTGTVELHDVRPTAVEGAGTVTREGGSPSRSAATAGACHG